ncbi:hypothetical protein C8245_13270 [Paracidovorax avenae]|nr:hypothetical protein C8245_13270 [Paracidovorax avenae]
MLFSWWNQEGRQYGARSPEVRAFMKNPDNYVLDHLSITSRSPLDHLSINGSMGSKLGIKYEKPLN